MKKFLTYIIDDNNYVNYVRHIDDDIQIAKQNFKKEFEEFLQYPECDIYYIKLAEVDLTDIELKVLESDDESAISELLNELDQRADIIEEYSGEEAGNCLIGGLYFDKIGKDDYEDDENYFDLMTELRDEDENAYKALVKEFVDNQIDD